MLKRTNKDNLRLSLTHIDRDLYALYKNEVGQEINIQAELSLLVNQYMIDRLRTLNKNRVKYHDKPLDLSRWMPSTEGSMLGGEVQNEQSLRPSDVSGSGDTGA